MKVNLPKPCHEDWNKMDSQEKGRFCGSCEKLVVDFTQMSDTEIVNYFKAYKGQSTCGHFKKSQVDRKLIEKEKETIIQETPRKRLFLKELIAACFAFFLASTDSKAQGGAIYIGEETEQTNNNQEQKTEIAINGKIINGKEIVSNAIISIKGTEHKTVSLENGLFSIYIPFELAQNQEFVTLVVEYEGLETKEIEVTTAPTNQFIEIDFEKYELVFNVSDFTAPDLVFTAPNLEEESIHLLGFSVSIPDSITINGTVKNEADEIIVGAIVQIKGTSQETQTDINGNYSLVVPYGSTLIFRYSYYEAQEIEVEDKMVIDVKLEEELLLDGIAVFEDDFGN